MLYIDSNEKKSRFYTDLNLGNSSTIELTAERLQKINKKNNEKIFVKKIKEYEV